jgi:hypothetical protein
MKLPILPCPSYPSPSRLINGLKLGKVYFVNNEATTLPYGHVLSNRSYEPGSHMVLYSEGEWH